MNGCGPEGNFDVVADSYKEADFTGACNAHDVCYSAGSTTARLACDDKLRADLHAACDQAYNPPPPPEPGPRPDGNPLEGCHKEAEKYYFFVREAGQGFYDGRGDPR